jgi:hypothetical protein
MFLGMRGNGDWATDQRPKNWREQILYLYPNGMTPLTAILSMMGSESVDDPEFNWWTQTFATSRGAVTGAYTDAALSAAYTSGGVAGNTLFIKMSAADAALFREGHQVLLRDASDYTVDCTAKVLDVVINGASSYLAIKLLEDDDNSTAGDISDADVIMAIGNINPEGGSTPPPLAKDPTKFSNYTQIFRTSLAMTRTAKKTRLRTGNQYQKAKKEALEMHSIDMELAFLHGVATENIGANGKVERTTGGLLPWIKANAATNISDFVTADSGFDVAYTGTSWATSGESWMNEMLERIFRYGSGEKLALCGSGALLGINKLALAGGTVQLQPGAKTYGMDVRTWITPFGTLHLKTAPLFSFEATTRNSMVIFEPKNLIYRPLDDTNFLPNRQENGTDGTLDEYLTECGLEMHHPATCGILYGVGKANP